MALRKKERLAEAIQAEVSRIILFELTDPRIGFVTVTGVDLSGDLHSAVVKISVLGDERAQAVTMNVIRHARGRVQKLLCERIATKFVPAVSFEADDSIKKSIRLSKALKGIAEK
jgi:ribosome-binding factor A